MLKDSNNKDKQSKDKRLKTSKQAYKADRQNTLKRNIREKDINIYKQMPQEKHRK